MAENQIDSKNEAPLNSIKCAVPDYAKAEMDSLLHALQLSHHERFLMATRLYKIGKMMQNAKLSHNPLIKKT
jgi:hypothetical protein